jgi:hypothetical protein
MNDTEVFTHSDNRPGCDTAHNTATPDEIDDGSLGISVLQVPCLTLLRHSRCYEYHPNPLPPYSHYLLPVVGDE